jgi:hypothetical protein
MAVQVLQTDTGDTPSPQIVRVALDGTVYLVGVRWNDRGACWSLDLSSEDGSPLAQGLAVRNAGMPINSQLRTRAGFPPGLLLAVPASEPNVDAAMSELGGRVRIVYVEAADVDAIFAAAGA